MLLKILLLSTLCLASGEKFRCNQRSALLQLKHPAYIFSLRILDGVTQVTDGHFVFSPLTTWLQLHAIGEGATNTTLREITKVTKRHRHLCFRKKLGEVIKTMNKELRNESKRRGVLVIDQLMAVKHRFKVNVERLYGIKVLQLDFTNPVKSAMKVNSIMSRGTDGHVNEIVYSGDFNSTVFFSDAMYFKTKWKKPFNSSYTSIEPFYNENGAYLIGNVKMMNQVGLFNITDYPLIHATVLELPCENDRFSMLIFKPNPNSWVGDMFLALEKIRLSYIFNFFKRQGAKQVTVKLPRFQMTTNIETVPEFLYDMGVKRIFNPDLADLRGISDYKIHVSLMTQTAGIEVTEEGVTASADVQFLVRAPPAEFIANKPFAFMLVDRRTESIIFAGMYTDPEIY